MYPGTVASTQWPASRLMRYRSTVFAFLCLAGLFLPVVSRSFAGMPNTLAWLLDLASHWQWLFLAGLVLFGAISMWRERRMALLLLATPLPWLTASEPAPATRGEGPQLRVAATNVGLASRKPDTLLDWLDKQGIDLVALSEVSPAYAQALQEHSGFGYRRLEPSRGPFGLALLSRHPLVESEVLRDADRIPRIRATLLWQGRAVTVTAVHPMPPLSIYFHGARNDLLRTAANQAGPETRPGLLLGDLNASPWSSGMLGPSAAGFRRATGLWPSWPAVLHGFLGIPIDQILVSGHWGVTDSGTGPILTSDHIPVWANLSLRSDRTGN